MEKALFRRVGVQVFQDTAKNGIDFVVCPIHETHQKTFAVVFGKGGECVDETITGTKIPAGTAHFLEHRMFQTPEGDGLSILTDMGCDANAYTDSSATCYYFSTYGDYKKPFKFLLDMCTNFYMSEADVARETEIILRERERGFDNPAQVFDEALRKAMYWHAPIKDDIIGTEESIRSVHVSTLRKFYKAYYSTDNMTVIALGDVDPDEFEKFVNSYKPSNHFQPLEAVKAPQIPEDRTRVRRSHVDVPSPNGNSYLGLGVKFPDRKSLFDKYGDLVFALYELLPDLLFSPILEPIDNLLKKGLMISTAQGHIEESGEDAYFSILIPTNAPKKLASELDKHLDNPIAAITPFGGEYKAIKLGYLADAVMTASNPSELMDEMVDSYENHLAWPAVAGQAAIMKSKDAFTFLKDFSSWPRVWVRLTKPTDNKDEKEEDEDWD